MDALLLATLNAVWQGAAIVAIVTLVLRAGLRRNATTACVVWSVAFAVIAALPILDFALAHPARLAAAPAATIARDAVAGGVAAFDVRSTRVQPASGRPADSLEMPKRVLRAAGATAAQRGRMLAMQLGSLASAVSRAWGLAIVAAWALVAGLLLARLGRAYRAVARVKRCATPLDDSGIAAQLRRAGHRRQATVGSSADVQIPCALGFRRPMILIPASLIGSLDRDDLARIVLHESAHLQRYDDCVNALEQIVCALQFFQPALYLARRRIDFEREVACDDRVLEDSGEPLRYAECLARIVQRHVGGRQVAVVPGFVLRRTQVVARVRRIVDRSRDASPHLRFGALALGGALLAPTLGLAGLQVPVVAPAAAAPAAPTPARPRPVPAVSAATIVRVRVHPRARAFAQRSSVHAARAARAAAALASRKVRVVPDVVIVRAPRPALPALHAALPAIEIDDPSKTTPNVRVGPPRRARTTTVTAEETTDIASVAVASASRATRLAMAAQSRIIVFAHAHTAGRLHDDDLLAAIDDVKYPHPSVDELIALKNHGVSASYVRTMGVLGANRPSLDQLIVLAEQGIGAVYFATLQRRLSTPPTIDQVIALRAQGVSAAWLEAVAAAGYPALSAGDAAALAQQGVSSSYIRGLIEAGLRNVTPSQLIELHNQGVDGSFVRRLYARGYRNFGVDELFRLKASGFEP